MNDLERLEHTLKLLREADAQRQAPDPIETRLRAEFRARHADPSHHWFGRWQWAGALAFSVAAGLLAWKLALPPAVEAPRPPVIAASVPAFALEKPKPPQPGPAPARSVRPRVAAPVTVASSPRPDAVEFIALPYAPPMFPEDQGQVIRVRLPRQSMRRFGFPVNEERLADRIPADILMGEDGVARGIRLVRASDMR